MEDQVRIVSTKKLLPGQKQYLLNAGFSVVEADFISIKLKEFSFNEEVDFLIFSSQNAVESILKNKNTSQLRSIDCFAVGRKTKAALEEHGFHVLRWADYASELASMICNQYAEKRFAFFSGNLRRDILPDALQLAKVNFKEIEVYETVLTPHKISSNPDGLLFFSPSAVESYLKMNTITNETCFCIGETTAESIDKKTSNCIVAHQPSVENVIIQCIKYYSNT